MEWIANKRNPPIYIWEGDTWFNESDKNIYFPNIKEGMWISANERIPFPKRTKIIRHNRDAVL